MIDKSESPMSGAALRAQSQESRDDILKAAMQLFAGRGFHETSMAEVAREAKVSKALIFWHFKTKEELFLAVLSRLLEPYYIDFAQESRELDERAQVQRLIQSYLVFVRENANSVRFFLTRILHDDDVPDSVTGQIRMLYEGYQSLLVDLLRRSQAKGICSPSLKPEQAVSFLLSALNGFLLELLFLRSPDFDLQGAVEMLSGLLFQDGPQTACGGSRGGAA
jgi:AcrR family transcriptional regulator